MSVRAAFGIRITTTTSGDVPVRMSDPDGLRGGRRTTSRIGTEMLGLLHHAAPRGFDKLDEILNLGDGAELAPQGFERLRRVELGRQ